MNALKTLKQRLANELIVLQRDGAFLPGDPQALAAVVIGCLDGVLLQELLEPGCTRAPAVRRALRETIERAVRRGGAR